MTLEEKSPELDQVNLTMLHLATSNPGATSQAEAVEKTWEFFKKPVDGIPSVQAWNGDSFTYYPEGKGLKDLMTGNREDFLKLRYGPCAAFAAMFLESLRINNLVVDSIMIKAKDRSRFMVENWRAEEQSFPEEERFQFFLTNEGGVEYGMVPSPSSYGDLINESGLPGQNSPTPSEKVFLQHFIIDLSEVPGLEGDRYYDPSYGVTFKDADDFEKEVVFGYAYEVRKMPSGEMFYKVQQVIPTLYPRNIEFIHW